jgi:hypothetical protein
MAYALARKSKGSGSAPVRPIRRHGPARGAGFMGHAWTPGDPANSRLAASPPLPVVQAKLEIGAPNDRFEQEAELVAEQVMRMPDPAIGTRSAPLGVQRLCAECEEEVQRQPIEEEDEELRMTRRSGAIPEIGSGLRAQISGLRGGGQPLSPALRGFFEPRFGHDFSQVHLHHGSQAGEAARALGARAYTLGQDVVFGQGQYRPESNQGRRLIAHELVHTLQQGAAHRLRRAPISACTSTTDESNIVAGHKLTNSTISKPGDKATIDITFGCKPRSFRSQIVDASGNKTQEQIFSIFPRDEPTLKLGGDGKWSRTWDGKWKFADVGTFIADDGTYRHKVSEVAYAVGPEGDRVASDANTTFESPPIQVTTRQSVTKGQKGKESLHLHDPSGKETGNVEKLAAAIMSEAGNFADAEKQAVAWAIRNEMVRVNSFDVEDARKAFKFVNTRAGGDPEKNIARDVLSKDMSEDITSGAIKWYSPRAMPPNKGNCKPEPGKPARTPSPGDRDCMGGRVDIGEGGQWSYAPGFHNNMTYVQIAGVNEWNFRFYKL